MRLENRSASRASAHSRRVHPSPFLQALIERGERKVEQDHEGELVVEQVVAHVCAGIVRGERLVEGPDRPDVQVRLAPEVASDLEHVAVEGLEHELHAREQSVACSGVAGIVLANECGERGGVAISFAGVTVSLGSVAVALADVAISRGGIAGIVQPPELRNLREAAGDARPLGFAVLRNQLLFECGHCFRSPRRLNLCERWDASEHKDERAQPSDQHAPENSKYPDSMTFVVRQARHERGWPA